MARLVIRVPDGGGRADQVVAGGLSGFSRRKVQDLLARGRIRVGGRRLRKGDTLAAGAEVVVDFDPEPDLAPEPDPPVAVLHADTEVVALDKPPGRPAHALRSEDHGTIANFLAARFPETRAASEKPLDHGLVHRLDNETSGVLLAARTRDAWLELRRQFRRREVEKTYVALVDGHVAGPGSIDRPIEPDPRNRRRVRVVGNGREPSPRARAAETRYRPLARHPHHTLLEIEMPTGVMHQIRAHLASIGHPVAGDSLYGTAGDRFARHLLHASAIAFHHPRTREPLRIESPLPPDFLTALTSIRRKRNRGSSSYSSKLVL